MARPLRLMVLTAAQTLLENDQTAWVQAHLIDGAPISIYPGHAPLLAETVAGPLRYIDSVGEHTLNLGNGILQVGRDGVIVLTSGMAQPCEDCEPLQGFEEDFHFDRLTRELFAKLKAQPDGILTVEHDK